MEFNTKITRIPVSLIDENSWNPNVLSDQKFNKLVEEITEMGFLDPIQVVPLPTGRYRILGGAHRFNACLILGYEEVPAIVLDDPKFQDEDLQKFLTLRLNLIKGQMTREKFSHMYEDLATRYSEDFIRDAMALIDKNEWEKIRKDLLGKVKEMVKGTEFMDNFDDTVKELKTLDDITKLLEDIYRRKDKGEKLDKILAIGMGGGKIVYFPVDREVWGEIENIRRLSEEKKIFLPEVIQGIIEEV